MHDLRSSGYVWEFPPLDYSMLVNRYSATGNVLRATHSGSTPTNGNYDSLWFSSGAGLVRSAVRSWDDYNLYAPFDFYIRARLLQTSLGVEVTMPANPKQTELSQNYPNPFNPTTTIDYILPKSGYVTLEVFNVLGKRVLSADRGFRTQGHHHTTLEFEKLPAGVYFYRLSFEGQSLTRKALLLR
jgi:hypothetical protein